MRFPLRQPDARDYSSSSRSSSGARLRSGRSQRGTAARAGWLAAVFFALLLAIGGGGSPAPFAELALELLTVIIAVLWLSGFAGDAVQRVPRTAWAVAALVIAVPLVQLIPLPPLIWQALPGRALAADALALVGEQSSWRAWSLAPQRTLASLLSLGPPLLLLVMTGALPVRERIMLIGALLAMAGATLILGAVQLSGGAADAVLNGFQANRNSTADVLLVAIIAVPLLAERKALRRQQKTASLALLAIAGTGMLVLAAGTVFTGSRVGIALLPVAALASLWLLRGRFALSPKKLAIALVTAAASVAAFFILVRTNAELARIFKRFSLFSEELRPQLWRDGIYVVRQHFPFGVGMGNFVPALLADERLEVVRPALPNRAHNDYIELAAEAGAFGMAALSEVSLLLTRAALRTRRMVQGESSDLLLFAAAALAILALHSLVDYPFRSMSLASLGAVCGGLLLTPRSADRQARHGSPTV